MKRPPEVGRKKQRKPHRQTACGKKRYRDHQEAVQALRRLREHSERGRIPARAYQCNRCGGWHLTSQS
jgi:hypothetical protein